MIIAIFLLQTVANVYVGLWETFQRRCCYHNIIDGRNVFFILQRTGGEEYFASPVVIYKAQLWLPLHVLRCTGRRRFEPSLVLRSWSHRNIGLSTISFYLLLHPTVNHRIVLRREATYFIPGRQTMVIFFCVPVGRTVQYLTGLSMSTSTVGTTTRIMYVQYLCVRFRVS